MTDGLDLHGTGASALGPVDPSGATPEPIRFVSTRSAMRCVDARVRFYPTFGPDELFSRDTGSRAS